MQRSTVLVVASGAIAVASVVALFALLIGAAAAIAVEGVCFGLVVALAAWTRPWSSERLSSTAEQVVVLVSVLVVGFVALASWAYAFGPREPACFQPAPGVATTIPPRSADRLCPSVIVPPTTR